MRAMDMFLCRKNWNHCRHHQQLLMYAPIVRPSDLEAILGPPRFSLDTSDSLAFSDRDSDQCFSRIYGLLVMGQGKGGILMLSWGWCYMN